MAGEAVPRLQALQGARRLTRVPIESLETVPLLRIFDVAKAREFYVGVLGFTVDREHRCDESSAA